MPIYENNGEHETREEYISEMRDLYPSNFDPSEQTLGQKIQQKKSVIKPIVSVSSIVLLICIVFLTLNHSQSKVTNYCNTTALSNCQKAIKRYQYGYFYGLTSINTENQPVVLYVTKGNIYAAGDDQKAVNMEPTNINEDNVFGETADGTYFEWSGPWVYSLTPLSIKTIATIGCSKNIVIPGC